MPMITSILLDAGALGLVAHPTGAEDARRCLDGRDPRAGNELSLVPAAQSSPKRAGSTRKYAEKVATSRRLSLRLPWRSCEIVDSASPVSAATRAWVMPWASIKCASIATPATD